jgi:glycerol uptake facilitator-like aquaporin
MLVSIQCALPLTWGRDSGFSQAVITGLGMGFIVATMAWSLGDFGGGHMNPAVSFSMCLAMKISVLRGELAMVHTNVYQLSHPLI